MPMKLLDVETFRSAAQSGQAPEGTLFKFTTTEPQIRDETTRKARFVFSDATVDHAGDSIDVKGWDLSVFKRNPVALFAHASMDPPIGKASGVVVKDGQLVGDIQFADADTYPFADMVFRLVKGGFLNAVSVGFKPLDWAFSQDKTRPLGINFKKQLLLEISVCAIPCNPSALVEARSLGIDTRPLAEWAERALDHGDTVLMPRRGLEVLRSQAAEPRRSRVVRSASGMALNAAIDDIAASITTSKQTLKDLDEVMPSSSPNDQPATGNPDGGAFDQHLVEQAMGHLREAITRKGRALACIREALASSADPNPPERTPEDGQRRATTPSERLREANELRRSCAAETPEERRRYAADLRRTLSAPTQTVGERLAQARQIRRELDV